MSEEVGGVLARVLETIINELLRMDVEATRLAFNFFNHPAFLLLAFFFSTLLSSAVIILILFFFFVSSKKFKYLLSLLDVFLVFTVVQVMKLLIPRVRPNWINLNKTVFEVVGGSFPSLHAATAFSLAMILSRGEKKRKKALYYSLALIIAFSRVVLGVHYLLDIIAGALVGVLIALFFHFFRKDIKTGLFNHLF